MLHLFKEIMNFIKRFILKRDDINIIENNKEDIEPIVTENKEETIIINKDDVIMDKYNGTIIILDNGHAKSTPGKRSPLFEDGKTCFFEYEFNRDIVKRVTKSLNELGITCYNIVPELEEDIRLTERAKRTNKIGEKYGFSKCILISVHANAAGNGKDWLNARGWSVYTTKGVTKSDAIATIFYEEAEKILPKYGMKLRKDMSDGDPDWEENFTVLFASNCPAILTENLFYDNKMDVNFLMSEEGREVIANIHINAIKKICGLE